METRRDLLKKAALLAGAAGAGAVLPDSIQRALAIEPEPGSTYLDAEHVVILMQENRSFDHCYGTLQGVRGFNDPRAIRLPNGNPVWLQTNAAGETYAPFRLNLKESRATWMGSLPHSWTNQVDARNGGKYDRWLDAKPSGHKEYARMPLTLGYYTREDLPFYYALADAFTVCDQHFCSSLTGTTPNRLHLWTGTIRSKQEAAAPAAVRNEEVDYGAEASWTTFPERLEEHGISWKVYQNELSVAGLPGEHDAWLANFTDNPLEWFTQFRVRYSTGLRGRLERRLQALPGEILALETALPAANGDEAAKVRKQLEAAKAELERVREFRRQWSAESYAKLPARTRNLHERAFCANTGDPHQHELTTLTYRDGGTERSVQVPKGDVLHQFRQDVKNGQLPTVSWLVAPENFSDHPGAAWYGAWYLAEALDILTENPEVWKKTIFVLTYDENDGYFDHVPPYVAPHPQKPETGRVSDGIDTGLEYVTLEQDLRKKPPAEARESPIGLGYRVPLVVASPWSRGGWVCSEVFDHTSSLQLLETLLSRKTGKKVEETNISRWRRTVSGDLSSVFRPARAEAVTAPPFPSRDAFIQQIHQARFTPLPAGYRQLTPAEVEQARRESGTNPLLPAQEPGVRPSCALPYQLHAAGALDAEKRRFTLELAARNELFGGRAAGSPFLVYALGGPGGMSVRSYAVAAGATVADSWELLAGGAYHFEVHGPNGWMREFQGSGAEPPVAVEIEFQRIGKKPALSGIVEIRMLNHGDREHEITFRDHGYGAKEQRKVLRPGRSTMLLVNTRPSFGWYDFSVTIAGTEPFVRRCAGRVETGNTSFSDPVMGRVRPAAKG